MRVLQYVSPMNYVLLFLYSVKELRASCSASYNPKLKCEIYDKNITKTSELSASKRSQSQAFYIVCEWAREAVKPKRRKK